MKFLFLFVSFLIVISKCCDEEYLFEGFGIYLGSVPHFARSANANKTIETVLNLTYNDLGIRYYRTSFESYLSLKENQYGFPTDTPGNLSYIKLHEEISKYPNATVMASNWSPPHYMKGGEENVHWINPNYIQEYHKFIRKIYELFKDRFNITVEKISPMNEPENVFAPWEHTNLSPQQLCQMVHLFNDSLISVCPENSYYWISELYEEIGSKAMSRQGINCMDACHIFGTHAYALNLFGPIPENNFLAYYDLVPYTRKTKKPIWQTEVSSTFHNYRDEELQEAIDLGINIANFIGVTCIQRYYFWYSYTCGGSGESIMWGNTSDNCITIEFPKKYFAFKHFTLAAGSEKLKLKNCSPVSNPNVYCTQFGDKKIVFVNNDRSDIVLNWVGLENCLKDTFCCTDQSNQWNCDYKMKDFYTLPKKSVCSCEIRQSFKSASAANTKFHFKKLFILFIVFISSYNYFVFK